MSRRASLAFGLLLALSLAGCGGAAPAPAPAPVVLSVVGTNDLHGHLEALPLFGGYLRALREARAEDGAVVLLDGGDMFQGTLESNLAEGAPVVAAYAALGYDAVTIGNHEFDFGPLGPSPIPESPEDDPRGALRARAREAAYPFLTANLLVDETGARVAWENAPPSVLLERAGVKIGVIGVTTEDTLTTTIAANVADLRMAPLAESVAREADALRARGAQVILVAAHAGGRCERFDDPNDLSSCDPEEEIFAVARALPAGAVDVIVGGHTHRGVAHVVNGTPIIESYAYGRAFGRVDLVVDPARGVVDRRVHPPRDLCATGQLGDDCAPSEYEGRAVSPDPAVAAVTDPAIEAAREARERPLGVTLTGAFAQARERENALGNLFTDLMRAAHPEAEVALTNGGGLRADLPAGPLTYGALYLSFPFDNRFAVVRLTGAQLTAIVAANLQDDGSFFSLSGVRASARCEDGALAVTLTREGGEVIAPDETITLVTTDYVATGGDGFPAWEITVHDAQTVRDGVAEALTERGGALAPDAFFTPSSPRVSYRGERPLRCR